MDHRDNILGNLMPSMQQGVQDIASNNKENYDVGDMVTSDTSQRQRPRSSTSLSRHSGTSSSTQGRQQHKLKQRFTVIRKLGKGTYGKVQLAINRETGKEVAIKTIKKSKIENEQDLERVRREIQIMSSIEHPHIIHIYEVFENKDKIVLVMQYASGGELYEYVSQSKFLDESESRRLFRQIATAIFYCHQNKICHRDLKLENILLDEKNNAKLADFGLSNVFDKQRQLKTFCGSPLYASPEIVQGSPYEGPEVDCWSLGVLLYTLVYGAMPFDGSNFKRLVKLISEGSYYEPKPKSRASPLIKRLLCPDPKRRATIIDICSDPWVNGTAILKPPMSTIPEPQTSRNSLLQVAQDMANLTPVRRDILMSLLSPAVRTGSKNLVTSDINVADLTWKAAPDMSESSENQVPVASFVVRDLDERELESKPDISPEAAPASTEADQAPMEISATQSEYPFKEAAEETLDEPRMEVVQEIPIEQVQVEDQLLDVQKKEPIEATNSEIGEQMITNEPLEEGNSIETRADQEDEAIPDLQRKLIDESKMEVEADGIEISQPTGESSGTENSNIARCDESTVEATVESRPVSEMEGSIQADDKKLDDVGEKPKKTKKKIIVVKKKRKVTGSKKGKEDQAIETDQQQIADDITQEPESTIECDRNDMIQQATEPAKVESPLDMKPSIQPAQAEIEEVLPAPVETIPVASTTSDSSKQIDETPYCHVRRKSSMIADVSEKLLQQLAADAAGIVGTSPSVKLDQAQLAGQVCVAEKKDEYERRASLMVSDIGGLRRRSSCGSPIREVEISDDAIDTGEETPINKPASPLLGPRQSRSDSSETIKLDAIRPQIQSTSVTYEPPIEHKPIRSTFEINLMEEVPEKNVKTSQSTEPVERVQPSPQNQIIIGPTPITRSYKKVTFTKDGACITETGKIYATRADDGRMRRIERKSKVTHFPAREDPSGRDGQASEAYSECSEVVYEDQLGWPQMVESPARPFQGYDHGLERLIMPSSICDDRTEEEDFMTMTQSPVSTNRQPGQTSAERPARMDRTDSASTCSSDSTDAFDDIFDNWTGAISMFEQHRGKDSLHGLGSFDRKSMMQDPFRTPSIFSTLRRPHKHRHSPHRVSTSAAGSPRCGSVEPQQFERQQRHIPPGPKPRLPDVDEILNSRQDSAARDSGPFDRPSSAMAGSARVWRHQFGSRSNLTSTNMFFDDQGGYEPSSHVDQIDDFFQRPSSLMQEMSRKHAEVQRFFAKQHKQLWKGSTPSLFSPSGFGMENDGYGTSLRQAGRPKIPPKMWKEEQNDFFPQRPPSSSSSGQQSRLNQSLSSSGSRVHQPSVALDARPMRRNTANITSQQQPQESTTIQRTISRTSLLAEQMKRVQIGNDGLPPKQYSSAHCIELKRPSSSSSTTSQTQTQMQSKQQVIRTAGSAPSASSRTMSTTTTCDNFKTEEAESRIQNWLQDSSTNLSSSSGSKSSTSFAAVDSSTSRSTACEMQTQQSVFSLLDQLKSQGYRSMINQRMMQTSTNDKKSAISSFSSVSMVQEAEPNSIMVKEESVSTTHVSQSIVSPHIQDSTNDDCPAVESNQHQDSQAQESLSDAKLSNPVDSECIPTERPVEDPSSQPTNDERPQGAVTNEDIEDEDVRDAKAYVKAYADRIKETEIFLKTMQAEEEEAQRQRDQSYLFNNLALVNKLNGFRHCIPSNLNLHSAPKSAEYSSDLSSNLNFGYHSAPIQGLNFNPMSFNGHSSDAISSKVDTNSWSVFSRPTFQSSPHGCEMSTSVGQYRSKDTPFEYSKLTDDVLANRRSIGSGSDTLRSFVTPASTNFRRSRPQSMSIETYDSSFDPNYSSVFRSNRSTSQVRHKPLIGNSSPPDDTYMTEYQRAYGNSATRPTAVSRVTPAPETYSFSSEPKVNDKPSSDDEIDESMSAYRASSYIPKVIPQGAPSRISRSRVSRSSNFRHSAMSSMNDHVDDSISFDHDSSQRRRVSLHIVSNLDSSKCPPDSDEIGGRGISSCRTNSKNSDHFRRMSLQTDSRVARLSSAESESRLSELEQRIEANKRRREELLASSRSGELDSRSVTSSDDQKRESKKVMESVKADQGETNNISSTPVAEELSKLTTKQKLVGRPSRLESMEARIKRRSYFVRVEPPEFGSSSRRLSSSGLRNRTSTFD